MEKKAKEITLVFRRDGSVVSIYDDTVVEILETIGPLETRRASHVEPAASGGWIADLSLSQGPQLGPFHLRRQAIDEEIGWLEKNTLGEKHVDAYH